MTEEAYINQEKNYSKAKTPINVARVFDYIIMWSCFAVGIICTLTMLFGVFEVSGTTVNIVSVIEFIIAISKISIGNIYQSVSQMIISIIYIVCLIKLIKNLVGAIKFVCKTVKQRNDGDQKINLSKIYQYAVKISFSVLMTIFFCFVLADGEYNAGTVIVLVFLSLLYLSVSIIQVIRFRKPFNSSYNIIVFVFEIIRPVLYTLMFLLSVRFFIQPAIYNLSYGVQVVFGGYFGNGVAGVIHTIFKYLMLDILYFMIAITFFSSARNVVLSTSFTRDKDVYGRDIVKSHFKLLLILASVLFGLHIIVTVIGADGGVLSVIYAGSRVTILPILLFSVSFYLLALVFSSELSKTETVKSNNTRSGSAGSSDRTYRSADSNSDNTYHGTDSNSDNTYHGADGNSDKSYPGVDSKYSKEKIY